MIKAYSYIRFSTPEQSHGDSLRRQLDESRRYAAEHGLDLDESLRDYGISAYRGANRIKGALGRFLQLIQDDNIEKGSYLLVENLDRLSRQDVLEALTLFTSIIRAGITIVTLQDNMVYSKESIEKNWSQLIISITYMAKANKESQDKGTRLKDAWQNKRNELGKNMKLTSRCPSWLEPKIEQISPTRKRVTGFKVIKEAAEVINLIFDMKLQGKGANLIARELNDYEKAHGVKLWCPPGRKGKTPSWRGSYIKKILYSNRAVIGDFQPYERKDGKRVPIGEVLENFYPVIVKRDKFNRVQAYIAEHSDIRKRFTGRSDKVSNLFSHITECGYCGYPMHFIDKSNGWTYLVCDKKNRKIDGGCRQENIPYPQFEKLILHYCKGLEVKNIIKNEKAKVSELTRLRNEVKSIDGEIANHEKSARNRDEIIRFTDGFEAKRRMAIGLQEDLEMIALLKERKKKILEDIQALSKQEENTAEKLKNINELILLMKDLKSEGKEEELKSLRLNLRNQLRQLISKIVIGDYGIEMYFTSYEGRVLNFDNGEIIPLEFKFSKPLIEAIKEIYGFFDMDTYLDALDVFNDVKPEDALEVYGNKDL